jgi:hypothetical protein
MATSLTKNIYFVDGLENFADKGDVQHEPRRSKSGGRRSLESPRETPPPRLKGDQPHPPLILGILFLKTIRAIDVGKGEIKLDMDGMRSAFK